MAEGAVVKGSRSYRGAQREHDVRASAETFGDGHAGCVSRAMAATMARPSPAPVARRGPSARLNRSKARGRNPGGNPGPSSCTR